MGTVKRWDDPTRWSSGVPGKGRDLGREEAVRRDEAIRNNEPPPPPPVERPEDPAALQAAIVKAIDEASKKAENDEGFFKKFFTKTGAPAVEELEVVLGYPVTAAERDAAVEFIEERDTAPDAD